LLSSDQQPSVVERMLTDSAPRRFKRSAAANLNSCRSALEPATPSVLLSIDSRLIILNLLLISRHVLTRAYK
jgi:hypothetical protein